ncbi:MAG: efflux RND transporter periplasmic adaptor subunit [Bacteroidetes bacterium]|nr:efflux RND transporter periplasmic adaptor subunit [Bacteroidota bacterium]
MKRILKIFLGILMVVLFFSTFYYLFNKSRKKPVIYQTETAFHSDIIKKTVATGSVIPENEIEIKPQLSGIIDELYVEPGQKIKKGDPIARIRVIPNMSSLNNAENRVNIAKINLKNAEKDFDRNQPLHKQGVISDQEFQTISRNLESAKEELSSAEDNLVIIRDGVSTRSKGSSNTTVRSTITGTVLDVPVEVGFSVIEANNFNAGTTIASVADMNKMIFEGKVDESEVGKLKLGMPILLTLGAIENQTLHATLEYISPKGIEDQGAIQFEIKATVDDMDDVYIRAGYSANADIVLDRRDSVMCISEALIQFENEKPYVEVETTPQVFEKRFVKLGLSDGINVEILDGIDLKSKLKGKPKEEEGAEKPKMPKE